MLTERHVNVTEIRPAGSNTPAQSKKPKT